MNLTDEDVNKIPLWMAITPLVFLMIGLVGSVTLFGDGAASGPSQIVLMSTAVVTGILAMRRGHTIEELEGAIIQAIAMVFKAVLILLFVGSLIGSWMLAGTAPAIIHLGLGILDPSWFYPASMILCSLVAVSIGSSWTTAATVGLALVGIAQIYGLSAPVTAGAIISGAYFGDKMSPLSDTTNLAPAMVNTDLFVHIRHMFWTTFPAFVIALFLFIFIGLSGSVSISDMSSIEQARTFLSDNYNLGIPVYIPLIVLITMSIKKVPAMPTMIVGTAVGGLVAAFYQTDGAIAFGNSAGELSNGMAILKAVWMSVTDGYVASTGDEAIDALLSRGGMSSMLVTIWLVISAMCFGGLMEHTGFLRRIVLSALHRVRGTGSLILTTVLTGLGVNIVAGDQYIAIVLPGRMYQMEFKRRGLAPENLSRTVEDASTMTSALIPWNSCGAFMAATLGVATLDYMPYAFLNLLTPFIAVIYGFLNIKITPLAEAAE